ncbi:MAG: hypothetical protein AB7U44_09060 [Sulfuricurvum sp.]
MKKLLLLLPVGLLAATGFFWMALTPASSTTKNVAAESHTPRTSAELFSDSERLLRQIVRHGDEQSIQPLEMSLDQISIELDTRKKQGISVDKIETLLADYKKQSVQLNQKFAPYMKTLRQKSLFQQQHEHSFIASLEQIGLYELKTGYDDLEKLRTAYIKEPSEQSYAAYATKEKEIRQIISELYLDSVIETPLFTYLDNHKAYFDTVSKAYNDLGYQHIYQLRQNGYAIKMELQLLPTL